MIGDRAECVGIVEVHVAHREVGSPDGDPGGVHVCDFDWPGRRDLAGIEDAEVPACASGPSQQRLDVRSAAVDRELEARPPRLGHLEDGVAPGPDIADSDIAFDHADCREILPERRGWEVFAEFLLPECKVLRRIRVHGLIDATVHTAIGLPVTRQVQRRQPQRFVWRDRVLADPAPDVFVSDCGENSWRTDIHARELDVGHASCAGASTNVASGSSGSTM